MFLFLDSLNGLISRQNQQFRRQANIKKHHLTKDSNLLATCVWKYAPNLLRTEGYDWGAICLHLAAHYDLSGSQGAKTPIAVNVGEITCACGHLNQLSHV